STSNAQPLAAHFSAPVRVTAPEGRGYVRWRLFAVSSDGRRFTLFQPEIAVVSANRADVADAHDAAVRGFVGNGAGYAWSRGRFGRTYRDGGDGVAEARYLESVELAVRSSIAGAEWAFTTRRPDALFTYLSVGDGVDHDTWAEALPVPPVARDTARVNAARALRAAVWGLADRHLAALRRLAAARGNTAVIVSGDHGMRATWKVLRINAALAAAGLVVLDSTGRVDPRRSLAASPAGYWINVNTTSRGGPVPADSVAEVVDRAAAALLALHDANGAPVLRGVHRPTPNDSLGIGGPAGGDLYWDLAEGWRAVADARGRVLDDDRFVGGHHGFTSTDADMRTALCLWAPGVAPRRIATGRVIDVVPTALEWLGAAPPKDATGTSRLSALLGK
ncbi:MAG: alkaline phosphatase family protein, partial [Gemmatimonadaceae bacterium]|nr:alkaline phosphatase family protein [Gemmatimonadaceae bacterium]